MTDDRSFPTHPPKVVRDALRATTIGAAGRLQALIADRGLAAVGGGDVAAAIGDPAGSACVVEARASVPLRPAAGVLRDIVRLAQRAHRNPADTHLLAILRRESEGDELERALLESGDVVCGAAFGAGGRLREAWMTAGGAGDSCAVGMPPSCVSPLVRVPVWCEAADDLELGLHLVSRGRAGWDEDWPPHMHVVASLADLGLQRENPVDPECLAVASRCSACGLPARWAWFQSPAWTWQHLCGRGGFVAWCDECQVVVDYTETVMN